METPVTQLRIPPGLASSTNVLVTAPEALFHTTDQILCPICRGDVISGQTMCKFCFCSFADESSTNDDVDQVYSVALLPFVI